MRNSENGFPSDRIEQSLTVRNPRGYRPSFSVEEKKEGWWLKDRDRRIAFVHRGHLTFDPFEFSPFSSLNRKIFCHPLYDMASRINMHLSLLVNVRGNFERPDAGLKMNWQVSPAQVTLRVEQRHSSGVEAVTTLISGYKPQWEAYTYHLQALIREQHPPAVREFCNFYARGAGAGIPEEKKWQWTIWEAPDGRLMKMPHNPALTFGPLKVEHLTKRVKSSGFIGYGVESDFNPVVLVRQASVPFVSGTCDMWYDEHLSLEKPGMEDRVSGWTQAQAEIELVNVKPWLMEKFLTEACPVNISRQETAMFPCLGFAWNKVNTFSRPLTPTKPWTGMVFVPGEKRWLQKVRSAKCLANKSRDFGPTQTSGWQKTKGLAGQGCLSLRGENSLVTYWGPAGFAFCSVPGKRYRLEGWVCTRDQAKAGFRLANVWRNFFDEKVAVESQPETCREWKQISLELTAADYPFLYPQLFVVGKGVAYFDRLRLGPA